MGSSCEAWVFPLLVHRSYCIPGASLDAVMLLRKFFLNYGPVGLLCEDIRRPSSDFQPALHRVLLQRACMGPKPNTKHARLLTCGHGLPCMCFFLIHPLIQASQATDCLTDVYARFQATFIFEAPDLPCLLLYHARHTRSQHASTSRSRAVMPAPLRMAAPAARPLYTWSCGAKEDEGMS